MKALFPFAGLGALGCLGLVSALCAQSPTSTGSASLAAESNTTIDRLLDRIVERENSFLGTMMKRSPLVETYIQETSTAAKEARPDKDYYFLGRLRLNEAVSYEPLIAGTEGRQTAAPALPDPAPPAKSKLFRKNDPKKNAAAPPAPPKAAMTFFPRGFAQMAFVDIRDFNRQTYKFDFVGREFLGEIRCLLFDVAPLARGQAGKFVGRIWVEDRDNSIVRFDGSYIESPGPKTSEAERYFHFDSWRVQAGSGEWLPAQIYIEESGENGTPHFKAQTRLWDYEASPARKLDELTSILVENASDIKDQDAGADASPLESQRSWERQAEENVLARLERGGFLAPPGPVDEVLNAVVQNLIVSNKLNVEAKSRVLLTTPMETFSVGHTIVISRGLIDVLPDEASLALVLADELSHIVLVHKTPTQFAFHNRTMLSDAQLLQSLHFKRTPEEMAEAGKKTIEIMRASPYHKTSNLGLFLKALSSRTVTLPHLVAANLGDQVADPEALSRLAEFVSAAPELDDSKMEQIAALPLGSRVKLSPWNNRIELVKTRPLELLSPREKMPFEVTPFVLRLTRNDVTARTLPVEGGAAK